LVAPCHIWTTKGPGNGLIATTAPWSQPSEQEQADAAFIVRAVNAHDDLLDALQDTLRMLKAAHMQLGMQHNDNKRVVRAYAALSKAEGRS